MTAVTALIQISELVKHTQPPQKLVGGMSVNTHFQGSDKI
jgi:hypothetical protein